MNRFVGLGLVSLLLVSTSAAVAQTAPQKAPAAAYKAPRLSIGVPDLGGYWSNATLTPESRPMAMGERRVLTPQEIASIEGEIVKEIEEGNRPSDPNKGAYKVGGELPAADSAFNKPQYIAAGGAVGGYDRGWLDTGDSVMRVKGEPRTSIITTANGRPPARKAGAPAIRRPNTAGMGQADNPEIRSLGDRCLASFGRNGPPPMLANGFYNNNYQIVQSKNAVVINVEMVHDVRVVPIVANKAAAVHRTDGVRPYFGDSVGWYEGDTLVVETTNLPDFQAYQGAWQNLKVTERFTRAGKDRLHYAFTVEEPAVWDAAWGGEYEFASLSGVYEYACHEGNYAMEGILAGAREEERIARAARASAAATPAR